MRGQGNEASRSKARKKHVDIKGTICNPVVFRELDVRGTLKVNGLDLEVSGLAIDQLWYPTIEDRRNGTNAEVVVTIDIPSVERQFVPAWTQQLKKATTEKELSKPHRKYNCRAEFRQLSELGTVYGNWLRHQTWFDESMEPAMAGGMLISVCPILLYVGTPTVEEVRRIQSAKGLQPVAGVTHIASAAVQPSWSDKATDLQIDHVFELLRKLVALSALRSSPPKLDPNTRRLRQSELESVEAQEAAVGIELGRASARTVDARTAYIDAANLHDGKLEAAEGAADPNLAAIRKERDSVVPKARRAYEAACQAEQMVATRFDALFFKRDALHTLLAEAVDA